MRLKPCKYILDLAVLMSMKIRRYSELVHLLTLKERYEYLKLAGRVGESTFGFDRYLNQTLYRTSKWRKVRRDVIIRDEGRDLGVEGFEINDLIIVHHMNPISIEDVENENPEIFNPEFLICCSKLTHNAIHYGDERLLPQLPIERKPGDTKLW